MSEIQDRAYVGRLLKLVRIGQISVKQALLEYPKDPKDESLIAAYHALIHYEADEDLRAKDSLYKEEQDDYLEFLANTLENCENLPQNIIENYKKYYDTAPILHKKGFVGFIKSFWKDLNVKEDKE